MEDATRKYVPTSVRLMDQVREVLRFHHYAYNTEKSYISWILQYIRFHQKKHNKEYGQPGQMKRYAAGVLSGGGYSGPIP